MSNLILPQSQLPETQQFSELILYNHVIHKGVQGGTLLGLLGGLVQFKLSSKQPQQSLSHVLSRSTLIGATSMALVGAAMTVRRMRGREKIEWQDRAWRLQRNHVQTSMDVGSDLGLVAVALFTCHPPLLGLLAGCVAGTVYGKLTKPELE